MIATMGPNEAPPNRAVYKPSETCIRKVSDIMTIKKCGGWVSHALLENLQVKYFVFPGADVNTLLSFI